MHCALLGVWLAVVSAAGPQSIPRTSTVRVRAEARAVAVNPVTNEVFVTAGEGFLTIIDGATHRSGVIRIAHGGPGADYAGSAELGVDSILNRVYVSNFLTGGLSVLDRATDQVTEVGGGPMPGQPVVNTVTHTVYVPQPGYYPHTGLGADRIRVVDGTTLESHDVTVGIRPTSIAVDEIRNRVWVANAGDMLNQSDVLTMLDGATEQKRDVTVGPAPGLVAVDPNLGVVVVAGFFGFYTGGPPSISLVDEDTLNVRTLTVPVGLAQDLVANSVTGKAYLSTGLPPALLEIDLRTGETVELALTAAPGALAVDTARNRIYVAHPGDEQKIRHSVSIIDAGTRSVIEVEVGNQPIDVAVNPSDGTGWTVNYADSTVTAISWSAGCARCPRVVPPR
jgi:DNA-binding beta-propeller fold protein YncE